MKTLIFIKGGMSFGTYDEYLAWLKKDYTEWCNKTWNPEPQKKWKHHLASRWIDDKGVVYMPEMPCDLDAKYIEWKIVFESLMERLSGGDDITLIGHSLGGNFLLKYFSDFPLFGIHINQIHFIAACVSEGAFTAPENYDTLGSLGSKVHIWHAEDDMMVPFATAKILEKKLPDAQTHLFGSEKGYGHFHGIERILELEDVICQK